MDVVKRERGAVALVAMALVGIGIAIYLTAVHYAKVPLVCSTSGVVDCGPVLKSDFSVVPGTQLPITVPGMVWFAVSGGLAVTALRASLRGRAEPQRLRLAQLIWSAAGLLFVLYLVYAELVQLHHICAWCTGIHLLTLLTFLVALARWQATLLPEDSGSPRRDATSARAPATTATANGASGVRRAAMPAGPAVSRRAAKSVSQRATSRARGK